MVDHRGADKHLTLALSIVAINDTLEPDGVVPSTLVFDKHPLVHTGSETPKHRPTIEERANIALEAWQEMEKHMENMQINRALKHALPVAAFVTY